MTKFRRRTLDIDTPRGAGSVALLDFGDPARPIDIVFLHANGFTARTYAEILDPLGDHLRLVAFDQRGHGLTTLPTPMEGREDWTDFRDDLIAALTALDLSAPVILSGHSLGGSVSLMAASLLGERVSSLALFEPVIPKAPSRPTPDQTEHLIRLAEGAARRRSVFPDKQSAVAAYMGRGAFATWPEETIAAYVEDGLRPRGDGFELACAPAWEASTFRAQNQPVRALLMETPRPVTILRGAAHSTCWPTEDDPQLQANAEISLTTIPGTTHFLPIERPDLVRQTLLAVARG